MNKQISVKELLEEWKNFKPVVPLSFIVAYMKALRDK